MRLAPYRQVLALPGVTTVLVLTTLARIPVLAGGMVLTLHVVLSLEKGFGAAGTVFAVAVVGGAIGQPLAGRLTDRYGLRPVSIAGTLVALGFWASVGFMNYPTLLVASFVANVIQVPVFTVSRQALAALVPEQQRRTAYSLDSTAVELSFMAGPSLGTILVTQTSAQTATWVVGVGVVLSGVAFYLVNPPLRNESDDAAASLPRPALRTWLGSGMIAVLITATGATLVLGASEVAVVARLTESDDLAWASLVMALWSVYSLTGGLVYGGLRRAPGPIPLMTLLGATTVLVAFPSTWYWMLVAMVPAGVLTAPTIAAGADAVSRLAPAAVRGEAMGYYGAATNLGVAVGYPAAGVVIDAYGAGWGFASAGLVGVAIGMIAVLITRAAKLRQPRDRQPGDRPRGDRQPVLPEGDAPESTPMVVGSSQ